MKLMLPKIEVGLMNIMFSWNSNYIWWLSDVKDFAHPSAAITKLLIHPK